MTPPNRFPAGTFSCVIDNDPRFHLEALRWYAALTAVAGVDPTDCVVHVVGPTDSDALDILRGKGVVIRAVEAFDSRSPHCNKISGALSLAAAGVEGVAVLTDADVVICEDPRSLALRSGTVACKLVDAPNPPLETIKVIFEHAGVECPPIVNLDFDPEAETVEGNANGGLYLVPASLLDLVANNWARWAHWLLDHSDLMGPYSMFADQMAMTLTLRDRDIPVEQLGSRWNTPTHILEWIPDSVEIPAVMHYHQAVQPTGLLAKTGVSNIDARVDECNRAIAELWNLSFPNATFWEWRYRSNPELGSGVGSRGGPLLDKRRLLAYVVSRIRPQSTLDVGSGDGEATRGLGIPNYTGIDLSAEAVRLGQLARPADTFLVGTLAEHPLDADLTICLDVLIHQPDMEKYRDLVRRLILSAHRALLISGYEARPSGDPTMTHYHEPLSSTIRRFAPTGKLFTLRVEHEITTWLVDFELVVGNRPVTPIESTVERTRLASGTSLSQSLTLTVLHPRSLRPIFPLKAAMIVADDDASASICQGMLKRSCRVATNALSTKATGDRYAQGTNDWSCPGRSIPEQVVSG